MLGTKPPKKWIGFRASSKQFQDLLLKSFEFNSCYSEQVVSKNQSSTEKQHVIYICYMRINCSDLNSIFSVFFASNLPHSVTLKHFFTCGACSPQIWMNFAYVTWFFLHSWHIVARMNSCNFSALSRNFFSQLLRIFSQLLRIFSQLLRVHISQEFLRLYFEFLRLYFEFLRLYFSFLLL